AYRHLIPRYHRSFHLTYGEGLDRQVRSPQLFRRALPERRDADEGQRRLGPTVRSLRRTTWHDCAPGTGTFYSGDSVYRRSSEHGQPSLGGRASRRTGHWLSERVMASANGAHVILAPQDGRGTGKGGVYFPDEAHDVVLERLQEVVGGPLTYEEAFNGTTSHDYYTAALESGKTTGGDDFEPDSCHYLVPISIEIVEEFLGGFGDFGVEGEVLAVDLDDG